MLYALIWLFVVTLLGLWSLGAWALHAVATWTVTNAGALSGVASSTAAVTVPAELAPWLPPEVLQWVQALSGSFGPLVDQLLQAVPALSGAVTALSWGLWGLGAAVLLMLGVGLHVLMALWRRSGGGSGPQAGSAITARAPT